MFNNESAKKQILVTVTTSDGTVQQGNLIIGQTSDLLRTLNGDGKFLEFESMSGEKRFIAKNALAQIEPSDIPKVKKLIANSDIGKDFDPFKILKVGPDADAKTIHSAYLERVKSYHPDHFSSVDLPKEMAEYAENMVRLVNTAYKTLSPQQSYATCKPAQQDPTISL